MTETIFALATPPGRGAVAVVRISGPSTRDVLAALGAPGLAPRRASLRRLKDSQDAAVIDDALVLWFPGPRSYTGEDSAEFHVHGGQAVVEALSSALAGFGLRPADPGEFTRRAFQNGKLDLAQAEAVADLVDAESDAQRRQALDQLSGALGRRYEAWRQELIQLLALLEAEIDFPDEDLPGGLARRVGPRVALLVAALDQALAQDARGLRIRDGYRIALIGAPNAGKSSLFNRLVGREAAIVTSTAGTTRDVIEASFTLAGYKIVLADMAGLRETDQEIEAEGVRRAWAWAEAAALRVLVVDSSDSAGGWGQAAGLLRTGDFVFMNKADRRPAADLKALADEAERMRAEVIWGSAAHGEGLNQLHAVLAVKVREALSGADFPATTRLRHQARLATARAHLARGAAALEVGAELAAEDLRLAARAFDSVVGRVDAEDVLDIVFASFCIGK